MLSTLEMKMLTTIVGGLVIGAIACAVKPGKDNAGWIITIIVGILGSMIGQGIALLTDFSLGMLTPILCAIGLLFVYEKYSVKS